MKIIIKGITENIIIGCYEYEKLNRQLIVVDLVCELFAFNWIDTDELLATIDYDDLTNYVRILLNKKVYNLLEGMSQFIGSELLKKYPQIKAVTIDLLKPALSNINASEIKISYTAYRKHRVALALGSNHNFLPQQQLITAIELLGEWVEEIEISKFYQTSAYGGVVQNDFINATVVGCTKLSPELLLTKIKYIEKLMGKQEVCANGPRLIDIDIIFYDDIIYNKNYLTIPHVDVENRDFVLAPLAEIASNWIHPRLAKTVFQLYEELKQRQQPNIIEVVAYYKELSGEI